MILKVLEFEVIINEYYYYKSRVGEENKKCSTSWNGDTVEAQLKKRYESDDWQEKQHQKAWKCRTIMEINFPKIYITG